MILVREQAVARGVKLGRQSLRPAAVGMGQTNEPQIGSLYLSFIRVRSNTQDGLGFPAAEGLRHGARISTPLAGRRRDGSPDRTRQPQAYDRQHHSWRVGPLERHCRSAGKCRHGEACRGQTPFATLEQPAFTGAPDQKTQDGRAEQEIGEQALFRGNESLVEPRQSQVRHKRPQLLARGHVL